MGAPARGRSGGFRAAPGQNIMPAPSATSPACLPASGPQHSALPLVPMEASGPSKQGLCSPSAQGHGSSRSPLSSPHPGQRGQCCRFSQLKKRFQLTSLPSYRSPLPLQRNLVSPLPPFAPSSPGLSIIKLCPPSASKTAHLPMSPVTFCLVIDLASTVDGRLTPFSW